MTGLLAISFVVQVSSLIFVIGALALVVAMFLPGTQSKIVGAVGVGLMCVGFLASGNDGLQPAPYTPLPTPSPTPTPYTPTPQPLPIPAPTPTPNPVPIPLPLPPLTAFATDLRTAFAADGGAHEDAQVIAAMFAQFADDILFDREIIVNMNSLGASFARLQRYRYLTQTTPLAAKIPRTEARISAELKGRGFLDATEFNDEKRTAVSAMFREVSDAMRGL